MKAGSAKGAQFHLLVNICYSFFSMTVFLFFRVEKPTELWKGRREVKSPA